MTDTTTTPDQVPSDPGSTFGDSIRALEIDLRIIGMLVALGVIWIVFNVLSGGLFLTPRNLWNLSVQASAVGVMATGMVLVIVTRNIDLSVGSMVGFIGMAMALVQAEILPDIIGFDLCEVNPQLDVGTGITSYLAAHTVMEFLGHICDQPRWIARREAR